MASTTQVPLTQTVSLSPDSILAVPVCQLVATRCSICNENIGKATSEGLVEEAAILPCSHIFGSSCLDRWLEESPNHDCPICRRSMLYKVCGHIIKACSVETAPRSLTEEEMPDRCLRCCWGGMMEAELRILEERRLAEERALRGMKHYLPRMYGGMARESAEGVDGRIEELRRAWKVEIDAAIHMVEQKEGRDRW